MALHEDTLRDAILYGVGGSSSVPTPDSIFLNIINLIHKPPLVESMAQGDMDQIDYNEAISELENFYEKLADIIAKQVITHIKSYGELNNNSYLSVANTGGSEFDPLNNIT
jgi:hypothetical protein